MGIFSKFFKKKNIEIEKPQFLMHTSSVEPDEIYSLVPIYNKEVNNNSVFATDSEKLATLYLLQPFFSFKFGNNNSEIGVVVVGDDHDLLKLDFKSAYIYYVDSTTFNKVNNEEVLNHENKWISLEEVKINKDISPKNICFNDVLKEGIQVFWVRNSDLLLELDKEMMANEISNGDQKIEYLMNQTNWKPDSVMYINKFRNICPVTKTDTGYVVDYSKKTI